MKTFALAMVAAFSLAAIGETHSQTYPTRPVRMLVTFSAGSQADVLARLVSAKLAENSGQQVVVDNRPSAGGIVAGNIMMNATPDGHSHPRPAGLTPQKIDRILQRNDHREDL